MYGCAENFHYALFSVRLTLWKESVIEC